MERRNDNETAEGTERKPSWIKVRLPNGREFWDVKQLVEGKNLFTVCEEAHCPNRYECWNQGTATFMIAGERCTRACGFCATRTAKPGPLDPEESQHVAEAVVHMKLRHAVITMVTRDDLPDGAAAHFAQVIRAVRKASPSTIIEVLASDLNEKPSSIQTLMAARPHIFGHNLETVERLTPIVRFRAQYRRSLRVLRMALECVDGKVSTKSGIMLGLGKRRRAFPLHGRFAGARRHGPDVGAIPAPSRNHLPVVKYVHPDDFARYEEVARSKGFRHVASGPLVRSSYHAANFTPEADVLEAINEDLRKAGEL